MKKTLAALSLAFVCASMPALARDDMSKDDKIDMKTDYKMMKCDTNKDGMVSRAEHEAVASKMFGEADKDGNGSLSRDELKAALTKEMDEMNEWKGDKEE